MHFFNPAPLMKLVEIIKGKSTPQQVHNKAISVASEWGKTVVSSLDCPGFIVNRVARPFYLESWRCLESSIAGITTIDRALTEIAGFRMGPFSLTDLIGQDINVATTQSIFKRLHKPARLAPSPIQEHLGRVGGAGSSKNPPTQLAATGLLGVHADGTRERSSLFGRWPASRLFGIWVMNWSPPVLL